MDPEKVAAVLQDPAPNDREQLESFLGLVQYYGRHVNGLSSKAETLKELRCKVVD